MATANPRRATLPGGLPLADLAGSTRAGLRGGAGDACAANVEVANVLARLHVPGDHRAETRSWRSQMSELPAVADQMVLAHFIVSADVERSLRFYTDVLGGRLAFSHGNLRYVALANTFIIINVGGGPTDDKPT